MADRWRDLDTWDRNGSTSGPTPWQIYAEDDDADDNAGVNLELYCTVCAYICWLYKWATTLNFQFSLSEKKLLTSRGTVRFSRTAVLYDCENVTNSHFLYTSIYRVSSCVTSRVQQAPGVCVLDVAFSRGSLTHLVVISFVCSLSRRGIVHCETRSLEHACTTPGVSVMHRSRSDGLGHDRASCLTVWVQTNPFLL